MIYTVIFVDDTTMSIHIPSDNYAKVEVDTTNDMIKLCDYDDGCYFISKWSLIKIIYQQPPISELD